jgi:hypothetical protein
MKTARRKRRLERTGSKEIGCKSNKQTAPKHAWGGATFILTSTTKMSDACCLVFFHVVAQTGFIVKMMILESSPQSPGRNGIFARIRASWAQFSCECPLTRHERTKHACTTCGGTNSWHGSVMFPRMVCDLIGSKDIKFRPGSRASLGADLDELCKRRIDKYIPQAMETLKGRFWREIVEVNKNCTEEEINAKLPWAPVYVYSSDFLAGLMLLFWEVLAHTISLLPTFLAGAKLTLKAHAKNPLGHERQSLGADYSLNLAGNRWQQQDS